MTEKSISALSDEEVLLLSQVKMPPEQGNYLDRLLEKQQEGELTEEDRLDLQALMQIYHQLWLRQSEALREAVQRGLRKPMAS